MFLAVMSPEIEGPDMFPDPLFDFTDQVILVTGGSRGLGYQLVKAFAAP